MSHLLKVKNQKRDLIKIIKNNEMTNCVSKIIELNIEGII
jgi:hypothetical protein